MRRRYRWEVVAMLWVAYFLHQADRQIYSVVLDPLRADLGLSGYQAGLVSTVFTVVVAALSPLAGALGDRFPKHRILILAVAVWTAGTMLTGLAGTLMIMLLTRSILTGGGEAFYPPVSHALLAEHHAKTRARAISIHQTAQYAGPIASGFVAGWIAERFGWRHGFVVFGAAGLGLVLWMALRLRGAAAAETSARLPLLAGFAYCSRSPAVRRLGLAFAAVLFVSIGYGTWAPSIFGRQFGLSLSQAGFQTALWSSTAAMAGALLGGALSDRQAAAGRPRVTLQAVALLCAAPFLWLLGAAGSLPLALFALAATGFFRGIYEGTLAVTLYDYVEPRFRSSAAAVVLVIANALAAPSSAWLGWVADHADMGTSVSALCFLFLIAAWLLYSTRHQPRVAQIS
jgi:MFS family permease